MEKVASAFRFNRAGVIASAGRCDRAFGQPERRLSRTPSHDSREVGTRIHPAGQIRQDTQVRNQKRERFGREVLPHFKAFPLMTSKQTDFERFARICELVSDRRHLDLEGLEEIVRLAMEMNPSGKRKYIESEILKSLRSGERIVYATGNCGSS